MARASWIRGGSWPSQCAFYMLSPERKSRHTAVSSTLKRKLQIKSCTDAGSFASGILVC